MAKKKEQSTLNTRLADVKKDLKALCADKATASSLIKELISLQKQVDVEPTELYIPVKDVLVTYDFKAFSLIKCKTCIIFKTNGYRLVSMPLYNQGGDGGILYAQLNSLCEMKENYDKVDDETRNLYSLIFNLCIVILSLPIDAFADETFLLNVGKYIVEEKNKMYEKLINKTLKEENVEEVIKNDEFQKSMENMDEVKDDILKKGENGEI